MNFRSPLRVTMALCLISGLCACSDGVTLDSSEGDVPGPGEVPVDAGDNPTPGPVPLSGLAPHDTGFRDIHFSGSGQCSTCHDDLKDDAGTEVSIAEDWSSSMMANAARDPYWMAKFAAEIDRFPALEPLLQDTCTRCHAPMANEVARREGLSLDAFGEDGLFDTDSRLFDHAMEGVSCTLCHQIEDDPQLGSRETVSGGFRIARVDNPSDRPAYGPYSDPSGVYMQATTQFKPIYGPHMSDSAVCSACHDLLTPTDHLSAAGSGSPFPEQMVYSEWLNSDFARAGDTAQSCQDCHMPAVPGTVMLATAGGGIPRENFSRHTFLGANTVMQSILLAFSDELGVTADPAQLQASIERNRRFLAAAASLQIISADVFGDELVTRVQISNRAGHKLPSGFPSRRVFVHFVVTGSDGDIVFESGRLNDDGSVVGLDSDDDPSRYEPHYEVIDSADQVQVYEAVMSNAAAAVTYDLLQATRYLKDNRLLPAGLDKATAPDDIATAGQATWDADFDAGGDTIDYRVRLPVQGIYTVRVELVYQPLAYSHLQDLFDSEHLTPVRSFKTMFQASSLKAETIAVASTTVRAPLDLDP